MWFSSALLFGHTRKISIVVLCAFTMGVAGLAAGAQSRGESYRGETTSGQLLVARSKQRAGEYGVARKILLEALSKAPDSALLLNQLASVQQDLGEYLDAERSYLRALNSTTEPEDTPEQLIILQNLATLYLDTAQYSKGERVRDQLEKLEPESLKDHPAEAGSLLNVIGSLEHARNRNDEAERYYFRSLQLLHQGGGPWVIDAATVEANLGFVRLEDRQYPSAAALLRQAIHEIEIISGSGDPALIRPLINLASCENVSGHANEAEALARRAVELSVKIYGEGHPVTATAMLEQATALRSLRHKKLARDLEKRAKAWLRSNANENLAGYTVDVRSLTSAGIR
jgi:tetratricopeptide (TPR) repeat protein